MRDGFCTSMEEEGENDEVDEVDEGEELMPGVVLKRFATPETSATTVCPEFRQWAQCAVAGYTAASGELFAPRRSQWARVGDGDVCPGIELALRGMVVGQRARLECAARFAFGTKGRPAVLEGDRALPPDSDVLFVVELLALGNALPAGSLSTEQRIEEAQRKRENGNNFFAYHDHTKSTQCYGAALKALDGLAADIDPEDPQFAVAVKLMIDCGNNLAMAYIKLSDYKKAEGACIAVLQIEGGNLKALHRAGIAARMQDKFKESHLAFEKLLSLDPGNRAAERELLALRRREKEYHAKEAKMMKQMGALMFDKTAQCAADASEEKQTTNQHEAGKSPTFRGGGNDDSTGEQKVWSSSTEDGAGTNAVVSDPSSHRNIYFLVIIGAAACVLAVAAVSRTHMDARGGRAVGDSVAGDISTMDEL